MFININSYSTHFIKLTGWQLSGVTIGWMKTFPGGNFQGENYPGGNFLGGSCPGGSFPGWELTGGNHRVAIFRMGVFILPKI